LGSGPVGQVIVFYPRDSVSVAQFGPLVEILRRRSTPEGRADTYRLLHTSALNRGRPEEAARWLDSARASDPAGTAFHERAMLLGALVWGEDTTGIAAALAGAPGVNRQVSYALLELARGRPDSADLLAVRLRSDPALRDSIGDNHLRAAALLEAWSAAVRRDAALPTKLALADSLVRGRTAGDEVSAFILARLHEAAGQPERALVALRRRQSVLGDVTPGGLSALLRLEGGLAARTGEREAALRAYRAFLWWYDDPEPSRIPRRDSVRAELAALLKPGVS
jgi:hypothetical protein